MSNDITERPKRRMLGLWVQENEHLAFKKEAASYGYDLSTMLRLRIFGTIKGMRVTRRPTADIALLGDLLSRLIGLTSELNKVGSNINQIARRLNQGSHDAFGLDSALRQIEQLTHKILKVLEQIEAAITGRRKSLISEEE